MSWAILKGQAPPDTMYMGLDDSDRTVQNCLNGAALVTHRQKVPTEIACMWATLYRCEILLKGVKPTR